eukprot:TRINITY_DN4319_c0_g1_i1.p1 TRINITY_DN4319_c0_g1~~TRINITY_DN4319_c0_g1_i1.p1  ORF type:complete len:170 (-),score=60.35 TRINITY_DN4319_c0_g1_i1:259-768(-)
MAFPVHFQERFVFDLLKPEDEAEAANLVAEVFTTAEPLLAPSKIPAQLFHPFALQEVKRSTKLGLGLVCKDLTPGNGEKPKIISFALANDWIEDHTEEEQGPVPSFLFPIFAFLTALGKSFREKNSHVQKNQILHLFMGGTKKEYEGKGLGKKMRDLSITWPRRRSSMG